MSILYKSFSEKIDPNFKKLVNPINMSILPQLAFVLILGVAGFILSKRIQFLRRNILLGKAETRNDQPENRWKAMFLVALGQQKMFKRIVPAFLHALIYVGFLVINLEVLEFVLDGLLGTHRLFAPFLGGANGFWSMLVVPNGFRSPTTIPAGVPRK
jgi:hypothetical protein